MIAKLARLEYELFTKPSESISKLKSDARQKQWHTISTSILQIQQYAELVLKQRRRSRSSFKIAWRF